MKAEAGRLTEGSIRGHLWRLGLPMLIGVLSIIGFNLADAYFVGQLGTRELAAMSFTFPVVATLASLALGLGVGASSVIARAIGEGDRRVVKRLATDSLLLGLGIVGLVVVAGYFSIDPLFSLMGADAETLPLVREYMEIWYLGMPFIVIPMVGNSAIRATGDAKSPAVIMTFAALVNVVLDPVLIFGFAPLGVPSLGLKGAAIATVLARGLTFVASLAILHFRERLLTFSACGVDEVVQSWKKILYVGLPAAGNNIIVPASLGVVTGLVAEYGPEATAAFGVATRIESFSLVAMMAVSSSMGPIVGQNFGAGRGDRVRQAVRDGFAFCLAWGFFTALVLGVAGGTITGWFNDTPGVVNVGALYLKLVPISYGLEGVLLVTNAALNGFGRPIPSTVLSVSRMLVLYIPLALVGSRFFGVAGVFGAGLVANVVTGLGAWYWIHRLLNEKCPHGSKAHSDLIAAARAPSSK